MTTPLRFRRHALQIVTGVAIVCLLGTAVPWPAQAAPPVAPPAPAAETRVYRLTLDEYRHAEPLLRARAAPGAFTVTQLAQAGNAPDIAYPLPEGVETAATNGTTNVTATVTNGLPAEPGLVTDYAPPVPRARPVVDPVTHHTCDAMIDLIADLGRSNWSGDDWAVAVFIVIGVVVVVSVVVYAAAFLYEAVAGEGERAYWWDLEGHTALVMGEGSAGSLSGLRLSSGFVRGDARVGLVLEGGYLQARVQSKSTDARLRLDGGYGLAGAGVRWTLGGPEENPAYLGVDLVAGTATDPDVKWMSVARANLSFGIGPHLRIGGTLGAMYVDLDPVDNPLDYGDDFRALFGLEAGYRF